MDVPYADVRTHHPAVGERVGLHLWNGLHEVGDSDDRLFCRCWALLTCVANFLPLWSAILVGGVFDGTDLAEATLKDRIYRVRTVAYGDPEVYELGLFECYPVRRSCRQVGSMIQMTEPIVNDKELIEFEFPAEKVVVVAVNGEWELQVIDGKVRCPIRQRLECR